MSALSDHLATGTSTVCRAWIVRRADGAIFGFTDHDADLKVEGVICRASFGLAAGALESSTGLSVDNAEVKGAISHDAIRADDIRAGLWDAAAVTSYLVNWNEPGIVEVLFRGSLGEISWGGGAFSAELRGLAAQLNRTRGRVYQRRCDAVLGDGRCAKVLGPAYVADARIVDVVSNQNLIVEPSGSFSSHWFERGLLQVISGSAEGFSERIKNDRPSGGQREIALWQSLRMNLRIGDRVRLEAGCDKRLETCRRKFDNILNYRGFPSIPGEDWLMAYPSDARVNDGGRL